MIKKVVFFFSLFLIIIFSSCTQHQDSKIRCDGYYRNANHTIWYKFYEDGTHQYAMVSYDASKEQITNRLRKEQRFKGAYIIKGDKLKIVKTDKDNPETSGPYILSTDYKIINISKIRRTRTPTHGEPEVIDFYFENLF